MKIFDVLEFEKESDLEDFINKIDNNPDMCIAVLYDAVLKANSSNIYNEYEIKVLNKVYSILNALLIESEGEVKEEE